MHYGAATTVAAGSYARLCGKKETTPNGESEKGGADKRRKQKSKERKEEKGHRHTHTTDPRREGTLPSKKGLNPIQKRHRPCLEATDPPTRPPRSSCPSPRSVIESLSGWTRTSSTFSAVVRISFCHCSVELYATYNAFLYLYYKTAAYDPKTIHKAGEGRRDMHRHSHTKYIVT